MIGHLVRRARLAQVTNELDRFFEEQKMRIERSCDRAEERILEARRAATQVTIDTPAGECTIERRGHAHGHDQGVDWRERNL